MKTICIDARMWGIAHTGIGRYVENLIDNLPADPDIKIVLIVGPAHAHEPQLAKFEKYVARLHPYSILAQSEMFFLLWKIRPDLTHFTHFSIPVFWWGKFVVTIHDLIKNYSTGRATTTHHPWLYWFKYLGYRLVMFMAIHRSARVIVPAQYWKNELIRHYMVNPQKISVTYEGVSSYFAAAHRTRLHLEVPRPFIVYTGNLYPHKNVPTLIEAVELVNHNRTIPLNLVVVCARSVFESRLPRSRYAKFLGRVADDDLVGLYRHAAAFAFPSLIEGFGLPGLEAMAAGCPVIAAWASCLPEIYGDAALYFDPLSPSDLAYKIHMILSDNRLRQDLVVKGKKCVSKYSWSKMAKATWQIYQQMLP